MVPTSCREDKIPMIDLLVFILIALVGICTVPEVGGKHVLLIGDSVDRFIVTELCQVFNGDLGTWGMDWHKYRYIPWIRDKKGG